MQHPNPFLALRLQILNFVFHKQIKIACTEKTCKLQANPFVVASSNKCKLNSKSNNMQAPKVPPKIHTMQHKNCQGCNCKNPLPKTHISKLKTTCFTLVYFYILKILILKYIKHNIYFKNLLS